MMRRVWSIILWGVVLASIALGLSESAYGQRSEQVARGAELWSTTCNRCHNLRSPVERTGDQWDVIVNHMRTRANLTKSEVEAIVAFLRQATGDEDPASGEEDSGHDGTESQKADTSATARNKK